MSIQVPLIDEISTEKLGADLAQVVTAPCIVFLRGQLGAGKTTLVRGFLRALGYQETVKSPTYTVVEPYAFSELQCYHFDLYRIKSPYELDELGIREYFSSNSICLFEWPEQGDGVLPQADIEISFSVNPSSEPAKKGIRLASLVAHSANGEQVLKKL